LLKPPQLRSMVTPSQRRSIWTGPPDDGDLAAVLPDSHPFAISHPTCVTISAPSCLCAVHRFRMIRVALGHHPPLVDHLPVLVCSNISSTGAPTGTSPAGPRRLDKKLMPGSSSKVITAKLMAAPTGTP